MSRRSTIEKREILPDPVYNSRLVTKFINNVTKAGKKTVAERIFYGALGLIEERTGDDPVKIFKRAVDNSKPQVEVKSRRQLETAGRGEIAPGGRLHLPDSDRGAVGPPAGVGDPLVDRIRQGSS